MHPITYWVTQLNLLSHPEGGYYKEVYRSDDLINVSGVAHHQNYLRSVCTSIYFLLPGNTFSGFHRIKSDEVWHFYEGDSITIYVLNPNGKLLELKLGKRLEEGELLQQIVPAGSWFASKCSVPDSYSLCGCTVAPGFDFQDFELANADKLSLAYPENKEIISRLCRQ
ncbi:cupin domain-containing protein [soil metagenome]